MIRNSKQKLSDEVYFGPHQPTTTPTLQEVETEMCIKFSNVHYCK